MKSPVRRAQKRNRANFIRRQALKRKRVEMEQTLIAAEALLNLSSETPKNESVESSARGTFEKEPSVPGVSCQTDLTFDIIDKLMEDNQALRNENLSLKNKLERASFDESSFENNDSKVKKLTGLPNLVEQNMTSRQVTKFQQFLITLLKIKFNLNMDFLSVIFGISTSTVSRIFLDTIDLMYTYSVPPLLFWPDGEVVRKTSPMCFKSSYRNCVSIIDCFEIFCERPSDLKARAQTYSQYKHHNTVKYLISCTPQGVISFISKGWGGRTSDKFITENSGYLEYLLPGDTVLADRGFDISDSIAITGARLEIPAFTKGKMQLDAKDIETTRKIASVRIHIERVIGMLRQRYTFLNSIVPIRMLHSENQSVTTLDKIVHVACALCNVSPPIIPKD